MVGDVTSRRYRLVVNVLALLTAVALLLSSWALYTRFNETNVIRERNASIWHAVVCTIEHQVIVNSQIGEHPLTREKLQETLAFYDGLLVNDVHAAPCGLQGGTK